MSDVFDISKRELTHNQGKCIFKHLDIECDQRLKCDGNAKEGCPLSEISNIKPQTSKTISD